MDAKQQADIMAAQRRRQPAHETEKARRLRMMMVTPPATIYTSRAENARRQQIEIDQANERQQARWDELERAKREQARFEVELAMRKRGGR